MAEKLTFGHVMDHIDEYAKDYGAIQIHITDDTTTENVRDREVTLIPKKSC